MTRLHISVGHINNVTPGQLVGAIAGECDISSRNIGAIDIQKDFTVVELSADVAEAAMEVLNGGVFIAGTRIVVTPDNGKSTGSPRKAFTPGARRQHPSKTGKTGRGGKPEKPVRKPRGFIGE